MVYLFDQQIMEGHWLKEIASRRLFIIPRKGMRFDPIGPDDAVLGTLFLLDDESLSSVEQMRSLGFERVPHYHRRFNEDVGYFSG